MRLRERGGMAAARVIDGEVVTSLEDGRILKLPAERIARLLAVMDDLIEAAGTLNRRDAWCWTAPPLQPCWIWRIWSPPAGRTAR